MKYETYAEYDPRAVAQTQPALLTVWTGLGAYHDDLVLVGGLVPQYLCRHPANASALPRPAILDVDFGVALGASAGQYGTLSSNLRAQGFRSNSENPGRFERDVSGFTLYVDFLVEDGAQPRGTRMVDDVPANVMPGVVRALASARRVRVQGPDLLGARQDLTIRVCEIGPFLVLKLRAFLHRQQGKDAFDLLYSILHYDRGTPAALAAFAAEAQAGNPAFPDARQALETLFRDEDSPGPVRAAHFVYDAPDSSDTDDIDTHRRQVQQDTVSAARALLDAIRSGALPTDR